MALKEDAGIRTSSTRMHWGRVAAVLLSRATPARTAAAAGRPTRAAWRSSTDAMLTRPRFFRFYGLRGSSCSAPLLVCCCRRLNHERYRSRPRRVRRTPAAVRRGLLAPPRGSSGKFTLLSALQDAATAPPAGTPRRRSAAAPAGGRDRSRQHGTGRRGVARARRSRRRRLRRGRSPDPPTAIDHHGGGLRRGRVPARRRGPPEPAARGRRARGRRRPPGGAPAARPELCGNQNFTVRSC